ncbi:MAG: Intermembrane phospholipid transport system binding protein MlaD [Sodalis sp.]|uniref:outer membrane lipid asymmetry maintenance protein MlaD n=1 Tax=Sodalis sp. (in: enterobacteria) TaxID=1898979 RepID=UPI003872C4B3|nr:MAG: Intermembrane phospholipid transport system binding protein MlaD [Sodalis sp.]
MQTKKSEIWVGVFMIIAFCAIMSLCLKVADIRLVSNAATYRISASFDNIGGLKVRSPVRVGGVVIGRVADIILDPKTYAPKVIMDIEQTYNNIPDSSSLAIHTLGLLGEQYLALNIGFEDPETGTSILKDGGVIHDTKSAIVLEDLIGQFLYKSGCDNNSAGAVQSSGTSAGQ